ncbi:MAG TPA: hypothetical protein PLF40_03065 [Kofleriaceae bacterium]|nr:hypothetical protein [Kofleriaceae bacterium]
MAKTRPWTVLTPSPFEKLSSAVWRVEDNVPNMPLRRVMTIARRTDGGLVIHNAICLPDAMMVELAAWGPVQSIVVPNGMHRLDAHAWQARFPNAKVLCPSGARKKVEECVVVDGCYEDFPADSVVSLHMLDGVGAAEGYMQIVEPEGTTLVFNDAVFNMPHLGGVQGFVLKHLTQSSGGPKTSRLARFLLFKDKTAFAAQLRRLAALPNLKRVIVSHHQTIEGDCKSVLEQVAASLA